MTERDDALSRRYRELAREEPPAALDARVLAAARDAVKSPARNAWIRPLSIAAVLVLGIGVALRMQVEQPGVETSVPQPASSAEYPVSEAEAPPDAKPAPAPSSSELAPPAATPAPAARMRAHPPAPAESGRTDSPAAGAALERQAPRRAKAREETVPTRKPFVADPAPAMKAESPSALQSAPVPKASPPAAATPAAPPAAASAPLRARGGLADDSGTRAKRFGEPAERREAAQADPRIAELERIARLRAEGRDEEADRALDEFRRLHPGYRIDEAMWARVKPRGAP